MLYHQSLSPAYHGTLSWPYGHRLRTPLNAIRFQQSNQAGVFGLQLGRRIWFSHSSRTQCSSRPCRHTRRTGFCDISRPGNRFWRNSSSTGSASFHPSPAIRAISSSHTRSNAWIAFSSSNRTPAGGKGAMSSVRLRVSFSSMRCSATARVIGLPSSVKQWSKQAMIFSGASVSCSSP